MDDKLILSKLNHTWLLDLDGTIVKHNGYKIDGHDTLLPGAMEFFCSIPLNDMIIFLTSRESSYREMTENFLRQHHIRFNIIIFDVPYGERIVINDRKTTGLQCAYAINVDRDEEMQLTYKIDDTI